MKKSSLPSSVYLLSLCQALMMSSTSLMITVSALIGFDLADDKSFATLPLSLQFLGLMLTSIPASMIMGRWGRKAGFIMASIIGMASASLAVWAIVNHHFWWFAVAAFGVGIFNGFGSYYRFAAVDVATDQNKHTAISYVMAGGVIAAFVGPNLANFGRGIFSNEQFAGAFVFAVLFYFAIFIIMLFIKLPAAQELTTDNVARPLRQIMSQPVFIVALICGALGYAVMSYLMTATPLAMKHHAHAFDDTAFVIQWHVLAMFAPSFFTGNIISRFGVLNVMLMGAILAVACVVINLLGQSVWYFWIALVALGISWNFLFIGATSLLTETYHMAEKSKVQAVNDFTVFTLVTIASLSAGIFQHQFGWQKVNLGVLPLIAIILISLFWLKIKQERLN